MLGMRVLFTSWAWPTHLYAMVPLARACRAAGHDVVVASPPALADTIAGGSTGSSPRAANRARSPCLEYWTRAQVPGLHARTLVALAANLTAWGWSRRGRARRTTRRPPTR